MLHQFDHHTFADGSAPAALPEVSSRLVNDVHSQLNETNVSRVIDVESVPHLQQVVRSAAAAGQQISIAGGRHAMGGQQFGTGALLLDMPVLAAYWISTPSAGLSRSKPESSGRNSSRTCSGPAATSREHGESFRSRQEPTG